MNSDIYYDVRIIILCVQIKFITPVLLHAIKYVNVVLYKSVGLVDLVGLVGIKRQRRTGDCRIG
jgi:hypothetical protein